MAEFRIGDRVAVASDGYEKYGVYRGDEGVVVGRDRPLIGVEFDNPIEKGHSCHGKATPGYGLWILSQNLMPGFGKPPLTEIEINLSSILNGGET